MHRVRPLFALGLAAILAPAASARADTVVENACLPAVDGPIWCGDGGPARSAGFVHPSGLARAADGSVLVYDSGHPGGTRFAVVRRIAPDGIVSTVAGTGVAGSSGDGGPATRARISAEGAIAALPDGSFLISEADSHRVRRVAPDGTIATVAGTGVRGDAGDGGPAAAAQLGTPMAVAADGDGGYLIADAADGHIRRVAPDGGISTVATIPVKSLLKLGDGTFAFSVAALPGGRVAYSNGRVIDVADGGTVTTAYRVPAHQDPFQVGIWALAPAPDGTLQFTAGEFLYALGADGSVRRLAGYGGDTCHYPPDGGSALDLTLALPDGLLVLPDGSTLVSDWENSRIRLISPNGTAALFAGGAGSPKRGSCGFGAGETDMSAWAAFDLVRAAGTRRQLTVRLVTTLGAHVTVTLRRAGRTVFRASRTVAAGQATLRFAVRLSRGSYQVRLEGSADDLHVKDYPYGRFRVA